MTGLFVKWDCGCIGLGTRFLSPTHTEGFIIKACDEDRDAPVNSLSFFHRNMEGHTVSFLSKDQAEAMARQIAERLSMADRFEAIHRALDIPMVTYAKG